MLAQLAEAIGGGELRLRVRGGAGPATRCRARTRPRGVTAALRDAYAAQERVVARRWRPSLDGAGARVYAEGMCRNIRTLYNFAPPASEDEVRAAALQYVRKVSGFTKPSQANRRPSTARWPRSRPRPRSCSATW